MTDLHTPAPAPDGAVTLAGADPRAAGDAARGAGRSRCPVARTADGSWVLLGHAEVRDAALDDAAFSSTVSAHLQLPNGLDGAEHTRWRALVDRYFTPAEVQRLRGPFEDAARAVVVEHLGRTDAVAELGRRMAVRLMTVWLGWPRELEDELLDWMEQNQAATRSGDPARTRAVAERFDAIIRSVVGPRRAAAERGEAPADPDVTDRLIADDSLGRPLTDEEIVSVLRNWTAGDLGSLARCLGVVVHRIAEDPALQERLRAGATEAELADVVDECLRVDDPFVANRRVAARDVTVAGTTIAAGERVLLHWTAANRDAEAFGPDADAFDPSGHAADNLVWGVGRHVCPGRPLATLELCVAVTALLEATGQIRRDEERPAERGEHPVGGWRRLPVLLEPAA